MWQGWMRAIHPVLSLAALAWFFIRVIPKPDPDGPSIDDLDKIVADYVEGRAADGSDDETGGDR